MSALEGLTEIEKLERLIEDRKADAARYRSLAIEEENNLLILERRLAAISTEKQWQEFGDGVAGIKSPSGSCTIRFDASKEPQLSPDTIAKIARFVELPILSPEMVESLNQYRDKKIIIPLEEWLGRYEELSKFAGEILEDIRREP